MAESIWVIGWDYGCEGKDAPEIAFHTKEEAEANMHILGKEPRATAIYLTEVQIWQPWMSYVAEALGHRHQAMRSVLEDKP